MNKPTIIVVGGLNTDIFVSGIPSFPTPGGYVVGQKLHIGPGGKSRNIAQMIARLAKPNTVAMIGRTVKDSFGLWRPPYDALVQNGVNTEFVAFSNPTDDEFPGVALIPVDTSGNNEIFLAPGVNNDFSPADIDAASDLFVAAGKSGILALTLECPLPTAILAAQKAEANGLKVALDPGGLQPSMNVQPLLKSGIYAIKPNEHEAELLTGIRISGAASARRAAESILQLGIRHVLITTGKSGAYCFDGSTFNHIATPQIGTLQSDQTDETGCGDQAMAALCALLHEGASVQEAAKLAVAAGTLQFHRPGIQPISRHELDSLKI